MIPHDAARRIRMLGLDVDGVLTDNGVSLGWADGAASESKRFDITDGLGIALARRAGLLVAWVSGRPSEATRVRAEELGVDELVQERNATKVPALAAALQRRGIGWDELAYVGDDLADLPVMRRAGLPIAVVNAVPEVKAVSAWVTARPGGQGAVREVVEVLLQVQGRWDAACATYLGEREGSG